MEMNGREQGARRAGLLPVVVYIGSLLLAVLWSIKWLPLMFEMVRAQTEIGQRGIQGVPAAHAVFELVFVAAHYGVRWLPGVLLLLSVALFTRWRLQRA